mgnify:CR=1 FL=1
MSNYGWLDDYLLSKPGATKDYKLEWKWYRYMICGKMFAAICRPGLEHNPLYAGHDLITLKCEPMMAELLRAEYEEILPGFYTDKRNWNSILLDGDVPDSLMREMCDRSYRLVFSKLTKKLQKEIIEL